MRTINYNTYLDKVYGCFLGKTVAGTLGAPYEGVKMPMELPFSRSMIDAMLPNDDLDLQVLWLDVAEKYGDAFTSYDLLERFCSYCDYSPGEYAVMRKNFERGIYPPYSGSYCNDFYREGMGCPIRSELWACLAPGNAALAAELASRDGVLDHSGESVQAERFFAALEAEAFFTDDINELITAGLSVIPSDCRFAILVHDTLALCKTYGKMEPVLCGILDEYGHPDCTNMFQNMGITITSIILGEYDLIKTAMLAVNCGFDTDCTCASAGSVVGIIRGAEKMTKAHDLHEVRYVLSVRSERRSDSVFDLSEDIARLGIEFAKNTNKKTSIADAPGVSFTFEQKPRFTFTADYTPMPCVAPGKNCRVTLNIRQNGGEMCKCGLKFNVPAPLVADTPSDVEIGADAAASVTFDVSVAGETVVFPDRNIIRVTLICNGEEYIFNFGICCARVWRVDGPIWRTNPVIGKKDLAGGKSYWHMLPPSEGEGAATDTVRDFHLDFAIDTDTQYLDPDSLFTGFDEGYADEHAKKYFYQTQDSFRLSDFSGFYGPCVFYMSQIIIAPEDMTVYAQVGRTAPVTVFVNGSTVSYRGDCDTFTSENIHIAGIKLNKGENRIVLRLTQANADSKFSVVFSKGATCAAHYVCFDSKKIL